MKIQFFLTLIEFCISQTEMTPSSKQSVGGGRKLVSGGVQSPSEIYAPRGCAGICI